jgi:hypothetical protein
MFKSYTDSILAPQRLYDNLHKLHRNWMTTKILQALFWSQDKQTVELTPSLTKFLAISRILYQGQTFHVSTIYIKIIKSVPQHIT